MESGKGKQTAAGGGGGTSKTWSSDGGAAAAFPLAFAFPFGGIASKA